MDFYIYYRVQDAHAPTLRSKVQQMQAALATQYSVATGLKRRPQTSGDQQTWMEVYLAVPEDFSGALELAVQSAALSDWITGERHTEIFMDIAECA